MIRRALSLAVGLALTAAIGSCRWDEARSAPGDKVPVAVSIVPQAYFVERIGGEHVQVDVLVGPGQQPHTFDPTLKQMRRLGRARLYFRVGVPFERTLCRKLASAYKHLRIVDTRRGIDLQSMAHPHRHEQGHREGLEGQMDPHVWLSPPLAKVQSETICQELCKVDPAHEADYHENLAALHADLDRLHAKIAKDLAPLKGRTFYVLHPAFGHFAATYGLKQEAVETEGKAPGLRHIRQLLNKARADGVKVIFVQPQFATRQAEIIAAELAGSVVPIDPLAYDYIHNLKDISRKIQEALAPETP